MYDIEENLKTLKNCVGALLIVNHGIQLIF